MKFLIFLVIVVATLASDVAAILNCNDSAKDQLPFLARIRVRRRLDTSQFGCTGSVIDTRHILTAAECLDVASSADVYLGSNTVDSSDQHFKVFSFNFIIHNDYNSKTKKNNIALIRLLKKIAFNAFVKAIKLANSLPTNLYSGNVVASVVGWGNNGAVNISVTVISSRVCYVLTTGPISALLLSSNICVTVPANNVANGPCNGDAGAPLVLGTDANSVLIGLYSHLDTNCEAGRPSIFTLITDYLVWIKLNAIIYV